MTTRTGTRTRTKTATLTRLRVTELKAVVRKTARSPKLIKIIEEVVPREAIQSFRVLCVKGHEVFGFIEVTIDYKTKMPSYTVGGENAFCETAPATYAYDKPSSGTCPTWNEMIEWCALFCQEQGFEFCWSVSWSAWADRDELNAKYGLTPSTWVYRTEGGTVHSFPNSVCPGLSADVTIAPGLAD